MKQPGLFARALKAISQIVFPQAAWWGLLLPRTSFNYQQEVGDGLSSSVVAATVGWIARRFAEAPMVMVKDEEMEREHAMLDLVRRPNPFYSGRAMLMATAVSYNTDGNAYLIKVRNRQGKPVQLWYVPHSLMDPHWPVDGTAFIDYYSYRPLGTELKLDPEDVIHIRYGLDPQNVRKGLAPLKSLYREIFTDDEAANFSAALLRNFGVPGLVISPGSDDVEVRPTDKKAVKQFFRTHFGGDSRGEPLVMSSKTEVKQLSFSPESLDLSRLREIPEERVTAVLGVPAAVVGFGTGLQQTKVGATMKELREAAYEDCIIPMQNTIAEELDVQLLPEFETDRKVRVGFDLSDVRVLQEDQNKHAERVQRLVGSGMITVAEGRRELGYEVKPEHEIYQLSIATILIPAGRRLETPVAGGNGNGDGKARALLSGLKLLFLPAPVKSPESTQRLAQALLADWLRLSGIWETELAREFHRLGRAARAEWERLVEERGVETLGAGAPVKADIVELVAAAVHAERYAEYAPHFLRVAVSTYATVDSVLGLGIAFSDAAEMRIIAAGGIRRGLVDLTQQTKDALYEALAAAREAGEGPFEAASRIEEMVGGGHWHDPRTRARVIARTETKYAQNRSTFEVYREAGFERLVVIDGQLPTSDAECIARDGRIVTFEEAEEIMAIEHPNGTLSFAPATGGT